MSATSGMVPRSRASRVIRDRVFRAACWVVAGLSVAMLAILLGSIARQGAEHLDWSLLTDPPSRKAEKAGLGPAIWGSVGICAICAIVAIPLGVGTAIFLEEYQPRSSAFRRLHAFVQLNITNLAGVPSIVYGIIGLTVFVQVFGVLGNANRPLFQIGVDFYDQYVDESGEYLRLEVRGREAPVSTLESGTTLLDDFDQPVSVTVVAAFDGSDEGGRGVILADAEPDRIEHRRWYYLQLPFGRSVLAGGLTLMLVVLPIVIISAQEAIRAVPNSLREASYGLGSTKWQMVRLTTLPAAVPGIMTGSILAMSRAIGEAAPILILAGIVYITFTPQHLMDDFTAMPLQIYDWAGRPQEAFHRVAASGIIVLLAVLLTFNAIAIVIRQRFQRPLQ